MRIERPRVPIPSWSAYTDIGDDRLVQRRVENATFTYWPDDETDDNFVLKVTVDAELVVDEPTCTRMILEPGTQRLDKTLMGLLDPRWFADEVLRFTGLAPTGSGSYVLDPEGTGQRIAAVPRRRTVTASRLDEVAAIYRRAGITGVIRECHVSKSQAYRLVAQAREHHKLPKEES